MSKPIKYERFGVLLTAQEVETFEKLAEGKAIGDYLRQLLVADAKVKGVEMPPTVTAPNEKEEEIDPNEWVSRLAAETLSLYDNIPVPVGVAALVTAMAQLVVYMELETGDVKLPGVFKLMTATVDAMRAEMLAANPDKTIRTGKSSAPRSQEHRHRHHRPK